MDFSAVTDALASASFHKIADICVDNMLQVAADAVPYKNDWPYAIHLLGYIYIDDVNSARFLWKTVPTEIKEATPELVSAWKIGQCLWLRDYQGVYHAIRGFEWPPRVQLIVSAFSDRYTEKMFQLLQSAYLTISIQDMAPFLGMGEEDATRYVLSRGWSLDPATSNVDSEENALLEGSEIRYQQITEPDRVCGPSRTSVEHLRTQVSCNDQLCSNV